MQIVSSAADGQWFNIAAPQMGMHMLIPIEKNTEKENNLPVVTKDKKPKRFFFHVIMLAYHSWVFEQNNALNSVGFQGMQRVQSCWLFPQPAMLTGNGSFYR